MAHKFKRKAEVVEAVQLLWSTWGEVCDFGIPGDDAVGCCIDLDGRIINDTNGRIGIKLCRPDGDVLLAVEGDWLVRNPGSSKGMFVDKTVFEALYESVDPSQRAVVFEPDWGLYPTLAGRVRRSGRR